MPPHTGSADKVAERKSKPAAANDDDDFMWEQPQATSAKKTVATVSVSEKKPTVSSSTSDKKSSVASSFSGDKTVASSSLMWVDKYKPKTVGELIGNQAAIKKLRFVTLPLLIQFDTIDGILNPSKLLCHLVSAVNGCGCGTIATCTRRSNPLRTPRRIQAPRLCSSADHQALVSADMMYYLTVFIC